MSENYHEVTNVPPTEKMKIAMEETDKIIMEVFSGADDRIHKAVKELQDVGIIDQNGKLLNPELPPDMRPGSKTPVDYEQNNKDYEEWFKKGER